MFAPGPGEPPSPANQVHDFNPGISPNGLFWTAAVPADSVGVERADGGPSLQVADQPMADYHDLINALFGGVSVPGVVSYNVEWGDPSERVKIRNTDSDLAASVVRGSATVEWSGRTEQFEYVSDPAATSIALVAEWGHERNGVFFP